MHTTTENPKLIRAIVIAIVVIVISVAFVANGAAYMGGVSFVRDVMGFSDRVSYVFGGVLEMALAVFSLATLAYAYMGRPTGKVRIGMMGTAAASAAFGAAHEIHAYATGEMTLASALPGAAWRIGAVVVSVALWELVISLVCGQRARDARATERQHKIMYVYLKRVQLVGLVQGTWFARIARMMERHARMQTAKHVTPEERTAILSKYHESQESSAVISVAMADLARTTNDALSDLGDISAPQMPAPVAPVARQEIARTTPVARKQDATDDVHVQTVHAHDAQDAQPVQPVHVQEPRNVSPVQEAEGYTRTAAASVASASRAIRADLASASAKPGQGKADPRDRDACIALIRATWPTREETTGTKTYKMLRDAGYSMGERTAANYLKAAYSA